MEQNSAHGYAIQKDGIIDLKTVSHSEVAAMVNWLCCNGVMILRGATDDFVKKAFEDKRGDFKLVPVIVQVVN